MVRLGAVGAVAAALTLSGLPAIAATTSVDLDEVVTALRTDPVYVDETAERALTDDEIAALRSEIRNADTPIYIAVLPASAADVAGGDPAEVAAQVADGVGRPGTYGVVVGNRFRAGSTELADGEAGELASEALESSGDDTAAVLEDFVGRVRDAAGASAGSTGSEDDGGAASWVVPAVLVAGAGAVGLFMWRRRKRRQEEAAELARAQEAERQLLKAELSVLADDVIRLEAIVQLHPEAQSDFDAAVSRYRAAQAAVDYVDEPLDLGRVSRVIAEARYMMDRAQAVVEGREPPPPPRDLRRPGGHGEPALTLDGDHQPAYVGYPGGFNDGWFGGANGLFSGLLLGSVLAGGFGGWGWGGPTTFNEGGGGFGGHDFGGGDFGGGDFGGGDFGGGDFGGGDFGGGGC